MALGVWGQQFATKNYLYNQQDSLSQSIKQHLKLRTPKQNKEQLDEHQKELISQWEKKPLHEQYRKIICENPTHTNNWLRPSETEGFIIAAQDQILNTNFMKVIHKTRSRAKCRMCAEKNETVFHIVSECSKLAQKQYKHRHDTVCKHVHWLLCKANNIKVQPQWYNYMPNAVEETNEIKILQTNK